MKIQSNQNTTKKIMFYDVTKYVMMIYATGHEAYYKSFVAERIIANGSICIKMKNKASNVYIDIEIGNNVEVKMCSFAKIKMLLYRNGPDSSCARTSMHSSILFCF